MLEESPVFLSPVDGVFRPFLQVAGRAQELEVFGTIRASSRKRFNVIDVISRLETTAAIQASATLPLVDPTDVGRCVRTNCGMLSGTPAAVQLPYSFPVPCLPFPGGLERAFFVLSIPLSRLLAFALAHIRSLSIPSLELAVAFEGCLTVPLGCIRVRRPPFPGALPILLSVGGSIFDIALFDPFLVFLLSFGLALLDTLGVLISIFLSSSAVVIAALFAAASELVVSNVAGQTVHWTLGDV